MSNVAAVRKELKKHACWGVIYNNKRKLGRTLKIYAATPTVDEVARKVARKLDKLGIPNIVKVRSNRRYPSYPSSLLVHIADD